MPYNVPSAAELAQRNIANIEAALNQNTPPAEKAFNKTLAVMEAMALKELYKFAESQARESLAITASEKGLELLGHEYFVPRIHATPWEGRIIFDIPDGETLSPGNIFIGPAGLKYETTTEATAPDDNLESGVLAHIVCTEPGPAGDLIAGDRLIPQTNNQAPFATVEKSIRLGTNEEDIESWRMRILDVERSVGGGGNAADYRRWAQAVPGVARAYPFSGPPLDSEKISTPGDRTVYIEASMDINPDGIAPEELLDEVKSSLLVDPETGESRSILGFTSDNLWIKSIIRNEIYVTLIGLTVKTGSLASAQSLLTSSMDIYLRSFSKFIHGLDPDFEENDTLTNLNLSREIQNILDAYGGTVEDVLFGTSPSVVITQYKLNDNEKLKLGSITFTFAESPDE